VAQRQRELLQGALEAIAVDQQKAAQRDHQQRAPDYEGSSAAIGSPAGTPASGRPAL
jgi:hypothetical protein